MSDKEYTLDGAVFNDRTFQNKAMGIIDRRVRDVFSVPLETATTLADKPQTEITEETILAAIKTMEMSVKKKDTIKLLGMLGFTVVLNQWESNGRKIVYLGREYADAFAELAREKDNVNPEVNKND